MSSDDIKDRTRSDRRKHDAAYLEYERELGNPDSGWDMVVPELMDLVRYYKSTLEDLERDLHDNDLNISEIRKEAAEYRKQHKIT